AHLNAAYGIAFPPFTGAQGCTLAHVVAFYTGNASRPRLQLMNADIYEAEATEHSAEERSTPTARLNAQQLAAATFGEKRGSEFIARPLLIIAGAGTGKTNTLAHRVAHLIEHGVAPERILLLTFTRRAAQEML